MAGAADGRGGPSKGEQAQWTKQFLACAAELSQWEVVAEYASVTENYAQMAECLWRLHDWMRLKDIVLPKAMVGAQWPSKPPICSTNSANLVVHCGLPLILGCCGGNSLADAGMCVCTI